LLERGLPLQGEAHKAWVIRSAILKTLKVAIFADSMILA
jgi:hypothetical protein